MSDLKFVAKGNVIFINGHVTPPVYSFVSSLPGYKKYTDYGVMFAATRVHIGKFFEAFPDAQVEDRDGTLGAFFKKATPIIEHERLTKPKVKPFAHQAKALNVGLSRDKYAFFYQMGTGKSAIILNLAAELFARGDIDRAIIITTKRVVPQIVRNNIRSISRPACSARLRRFRRPRQISCLNIRSIIC